MVWRQVRPGIVKPGEEPTEARAMHWSWLNFVQACLHSPSIPVTRAARGCSHFGSHSREERAADHWRAICILQVTFCWSRGADDGVRIASIFTRPHSLSPGQIFSISGGHLSFQRATHCRLRDGETHLFPSGSEDSIQAHFAQNKSGVYN
jgi:hypothetical protein